ncbi:hydrogenase nickel incorporation protein HypB [Piscinibacter sakaiensis]|uniref:Hydrogenase maturation factor HypB n=1 Tax=Piscinibacter sakaiensis TaxID=1547922 RepID=A0A0K8P861_PISS1|nr:[NiFe] hydrogenase nickel incorporation-associated protein HypB [Piscinibacter sakaiensis]
MCVVCGCGPQGPAGTTGTDDTAGAPAPARTGAGARVDPRTGDLHYGAGAARVSVPGMSAARAIRLEADVLGENQRLADRNRAHFRAHGTTAFNLVSSPGAGKTTLLCATIRALRARLPGLGVAVIEGDQQTRLDADRIRATGAPAIQVNTGKGCHLDAQMVGEAYERLHHHHHHHGHGHAHGHDHDHDHDAGSPARQLLLIENVGNLVCPAMWDLGEAAKVAILSVTEGEDKPIKYPDMFAASALLVINKVDLLPHVDFDLARCIAHARQVNPTIEVLLVSATQGTGMDAWLDWLLATGELAPGRAADGAPTAAAAAGDEDSPAQLRRRIAELEARLAAASAAAAGR